MLQTEHVWPLAPSTDRLSSDNVERALSVKKVRRKNCIKCCGCIAVLLLILAIVMIILILTVFRVKEPDIKLNSFTVTQLGVISGSIPILKPGVNMSFIADISVKNPNVASYRYSNTTTSVYYHGMFVGEARGPPGRAKAQQNLRMNVTGDIITDRLLSSPNLQSDYVSGLLPVDSYSRVGGSVNILKVFKRHVTVTMNCSMTLNVSSLGIHEQKCKRKVDLWN